MNSGFDGSHVPESPMQKLARLSMDRAVDQYTQQMFTEADASFAGTTSFYLVDPPFTLSSSASAREEKKSSSNNLSTTSLTEVAEYDDNDDNTETMSSSSAKRQKKSSSPSTVQDKQQQLPMFLTKTFHMVGRCDPDIATWSEDGKSFMIKNVEKFAAVVLPQYFKHSNFSSFARQLNFYGFRKLKAEPILTADYDSRTANHMRFFHECFQKDKPELLLNIKRATKSEVQTKDEACSLRLDIQNLNETIVNMNAEFDLKIAQVTMEFNRKLAHLTTLYEQLRTLIVQQGTLLSQQGIVSGTFQHHPQQYIPQQINFQPASAISKRLGIVPLSSTSSHSNSAMQSLHQACMTLQSPAGPQPQSHVLLSAENSIPDLNQGNAFGMGVLNSSAFTSLGDGEAHQRGSDLSSDDFLLPPPRVS